MSEARPFLRWVGGKKRLAGVLGGFVPSVERDGRYFEPFFGAGSLFFCLRPPRAVIGDSNRELIACLRRVRNRPDLVWRHLRPCLALRGERAYIHARSLFNRLSDSYQRAALFIYLNKSCFNGIWRVNKNGLFNVPYGHKDGVAFPSLNDLAEVSRAFRRAKIRVGDFAQTVSDAGRGDFVYLDPPYPPLNGTAFFCHYTKERFNRNDHARVAEVFRLLTSRGCNVLLSYADVPLVRELYKGCRTIEVSTQRYVASHGRRYEVSDLAIMNYTP